MELCESETDARLTVLEAVSSSFAGWSLDEYQDRFKVGAFESVSRPLVEDVVREIERTNIPYPLALSALGREVIPLSDQRRSGAYYTDWRLAAHLASRAQSFRPQREKPWLDPACGSGTLLAAAAMTVDSGRERDDLIRESLVASDLSANAIRATRLTLASLTADLSVVSALDKRLIVQDSLASLESWCQVVPNGAALVIANPPWEKLRVTRHEAAKAIGEERSYGTDLQRPIDVETPRAEMLRYVRDVVASTRLQGSGEHDLYKLFLELGMGLLAEEGILAMLLPAGVIRSRGTEKLRNELESTSSRLVIDVLENRARHFAIDTRFKFVAITASGGRAAKDIELFVADRKGQLPSEPAVLNRRELRTVRPDLSVPETRSQTEWQLFSRLTSTGFRVGDSQSPWHPKYIREVDMTNDRRLFHRRSDSGSSIPVLEGRHITQYRWRSKAYLSGEGRSAAWQPVPLREATDASAQWYVTPGDLRDSVSQRVAVSRIGFCDITGQTNERTLICARIPAGVVCGNKVPTLEFQHGGREHEDLFLALTNSLVVDWMMRRLVTTTVNFFLLDSLPLPPVNIEDAVGRELVLLARQVSDEEGRPDADLRRVGRDRARIDALVASAWSISVDEMRLILEDFPLLDRHQPALAGENRSTITQDAVLSQLARINGDQDVWSSRLDSASRAGAAPFVPAEFAKGPQ